MIRALSHIARNHFAQYIVVDDSGTFKPCWSMKEAQEWLPYCGERAAIMGKVSREILVGRSQSRAY